MALKGLDGLVFSAGIGENARDVRQRIVDRLAWMGAGLDDNGASGERVISASDSRIKILVIPTDEERIIAVAALSVVS